MNSDNTDRLKMYLCDSACVEVRQQLVRMWVPGVELRSLDLMISPLFSRLTSLTLFTVMGKLRNELGISIEGM